jgi:hypothetical protein
MTKRTLQIGRTYRHWRGDPYTVIGTFEAINSYRSGMGLNLVEGYALVTSELPKGCEAVIHRNEFGYLFVRELKNFLEVLGGEDECAAYYRFELVSEAS